MLRQVSLENFKAFAKVSIDLGLITVLIGPNGTGKSSIARSLMLLKQSKGQIELRLNGPYVFLGDYQDVVHKKGMPAPELPRQPSDIAITIAASVDEEITKLGKLRSAKCVYSGGPSVQGSQIASTFLFRRDLEDQISKWFEDIVGLRLRARLVPGGNVAIETTDTPRLNLVNEGFGSNQLVHPSSKRQISFENSSAGSLYRD